MLQNICHICGKDIIIDCHYTSNITYRCNDHYIEHRWTNDLGNRIIVHKYFPNNNMFMTIDITNDRVSSYLGLNPRTEGLIPRTEITIKLDRNLIDKSNQEIFDLYQKLILLK